MHFHPSHRRNPSAPVVVRATHTPGLLSLAKQAIPPVPRFQQVPSQSKPNKTSPKGKSPRAPHSQARPVEPVKKPSAPKQQPADENKVPSPEKSSRGRQSIKPAAKDKADPRSISLSSQQRRRSQQPSPPLPPPARIPKQTDSSAEAHRARPLANRDSDFNFSDPFVVPSSDNLSEALKQSGSKNGAKLLAFRPPPPLAIRPTGKLAHRRRPTADMTGFTIPSVTPTKSRNNAVSGGVTSRRPAPRRASNSLPLTSWDFPVCDDSDDSTPPSTPVRESASVPLRKTGATWQQKALFFDEPLRSAPLSSTFQFPGAPSSSPTPAQRRRHHRVPSEGVFAMSTDEESSSDTSDESRFATNPKRRNSVTPRRTPSPASSDRSSSVTPGFYAGSVFQNSPSPDELPVPAFMA